MLLSQMLSEQKKSHKKTRNLGLVLILTLIVGYTFLSILFGGEAKPKTTQIIFPSGYTQPDDLFFAFLKQDRPYISQSLKEHFSRNGYLGTDIGTNKKELNLYAPSYEFLSADGIERDEERIFTVHLSDNPNTIGKAIELTWEEHKGERHTFILGHASAILVKEGQQVATGDLLGLSGGCPGELQLGEKSTGCHLHFEHHVMGFPTVYPDYLYNNHKEDLEAVKKMKELAKDSEGKIARGEALAWDDPIYKWSIGSLYQIGGDGLVKAISAIHNAEGGRCAKNCKTSLANARGSLQFVKGTWEAYGCDGDGDGVADVDNLADSICGAGSYLEQLYANESKQAPELAPKWIFWKAACRYNSGYQFPCTHKDAPSDVVAYADGVVADMESMGAF